MASDRIILYRILYVHVYYLYIIYSTTIIIKQCNTYKIITK